MANLLMTSPPGGKASQATGASAVAAYKSARIEMGEYHRSRLEIFIQAPVWLFVLLAILVTVVNVLIAVKVF